MKIWGITEGQAENALDMANLRFEDNLVWNREPEPFGVRVTGVNCTLRVKDSSGAGAKRAAYSGRRTVAANYDAHYRFMEVIMEINPEARISTAMEDYRGIGEFYAKAGRVAEVNVGSQYRPVAFGDL